MSCQKFNLWIDNKPFQHWFYEISIPALFLCDTYKNNLE